MFVTVIYLIKEENHNFVSSRFNVSFLIIFLDHLSAKHKSSYTL